jgi:hypothetical protein
LVFFRAKNPKNPNLNPNCSQLEAEEAGGGLSAEEAAAALPCLRLLLCRRFLNGLHQVWPAWGAWGLLQRRHRDLHIICLLQCFNRVEVQDLLQNGKPLTLCYTMSTHV